MSIHELYKLIYQTQQDFIIFKTKFLTVFTTDKDPNYKNLGITKISGAIIYLSQSTIIIHSENKQKKIFVSDLSSHLYLEHSILFTFLISA